MHFKHLLLFVLFSPVATSLAQKKEISDKYKQNSKTKSDSTSKITMYSAQVYFQGNGLPNPKVFSCYGTNLDSMMKMIDSASQGADVIFDHLYAHYLNGFSKPIEKIPYNFNRKNYIPERKSLSQEEIDKLRSYRYISGTIYFTGAGFNTTLSTAATDSLNLKKMFSLCRPGSSVVLDNCIYIDTLGKKSKPISKSIKLE